MADAVIPTGSRPYRVLWRVQLRAPNHLWSQWLSVRTPTEREAVAEMRRIRPEWDVLQVEREKSP